MQLIFLASEDTIIFYINEIYILRDNASTKPFF